MNSQIKKIMKDFLDFDIKTSYEFKEVCGLTFVFKKDITIINDSVTSAEINPVGIIYKENEDYMIAPLERDIELEKIVKKYSSTIREEEYFQNQQ